MSEFGVVVLTSGREARLTRRGTWEVQPPNDNYWVEFATLAEALQYAGEEVSGEL